MEQATNLSILEAIESGLQYQQAGRLDEAEQIYRQILNQHPQQPEVLHLLGVLSFQRRDFELATIFIRQAISLCPEESNYYNNLGLALKGQGNFKDAVACYQKALELKPDYAAAFSNLGNALVQQGRFDEALQAFQSAIEIAPNDADTFYHRGNLLKDLGRSEEALASLQKALTINPNYTEALNSLGNFFLKEGRFEEALQAFQKVLAFNPASSDALYNVAKAFDQQGKMEEAYQCYQKVLDLNPQNHLALNNLGILLKEQGQPREALSCFQKALKIEPGCPEVLNNMSVTLMGRGQLEEAKHFCQKALEIKPDYPEAMNNLGNVLKDQGRVEEAFRCYEAAVKIDPQHSIAYHNLSFCQQYLPDITLAKIQATQAHWKNHCALPHQKQWGNYTNQRNTDKKLVLGFVSGDFKHHPVAFFTLSVFEQLATQCDVIIYANQRESDPFTARFQKTAFRWHTVHGWSSQQLAQKIREDEIDILFDLSGHTAKNRLDVFALKPSPIQITWAGDTATTGLEAMDYIIGDPYEIPPESEPYYQEQVIRMPHCSVCYTPPIEAPHITPLPALTNNHITFASFNKLSKINPAVVAIWSEILKQLPDSKLLFQTWGLNCPGTRQRYLDQFESHGVAAERILCQAPSSYTEFLSQYQQVDLQLDSFPFSGGTITMESLWMGVPVITFPGETFASRQSMRFLSNIGLTDFIAKDREHYIQLAVAWSHRLSDLNEVRQTLRDKVEQSPLCDALGFSQDLLRELREIWKRWCTEQI